VVRRTSANDIVNSVIQFLGVLIAWPVILLLVVLIFRRHIVDEIFKKILPALAQRLRNSGFALSQWMFSDSADADMARFSVNTNAHLAAQVTSPSGSTLF
jgi:hypothetical protein